MAIDNSFILKKFSTFDEIYVLYSGVTHLPFIECDEETFDDQVYIFTTAEMAKEFAHPFTLDKILLQAVQIPKQMIGSFMKSLYLYDVNAVMIQDKGAPVRVQLEQLAEKPDLEPMINDRIPRANPALQLTAIYFMQELMRPVARNPEERKHLRSLEEEMAHNLLRSRFIVTFDVTGIKGKWNPADKSQKVRVPLVKTKGGKMYQPVYTDTGEMQRFNRRNKGMKLEMTAVPYEKLTDFLVKESGGFVFNPSGFNLVLTSEQVKNMSKVYGD